MLPEFGTKCLLFSNLLKLEAFVRERLELKVSRCWISNYPQGGESRKSEVDSLDIEKIPTLVAQTNVGHQNNTDVSHRTSIEKSIGYNPVHAPFFYCR